MVRFASSASAGRNARPSLLLAYSSGSNEGMSAEKLSISFDDALAKTVRQAAAAEGMSISSWLADAAAAKARQRRLRDALDAFAVEHGRIEDEEIEEIVRTARTSSRLTGPKARRSGKSGRSTA